MADAVRFRYFTPGLLLLTLLWVGIFFLAFPEPLALFLRNWPLILVGVGGAFIGNITAIGGGLVFIPVMIFIYHLSPMESLKLAFVTQAVGMTSGASGWLRRREVPLPLLRWTVPGLIAGTLLASFAFHPSGMLVKSMFGPVSLLVGLLVLITLNRSGTRESLPQQAWWIILLVSIVGGMVTGWVAIGEGEIIAAFCMIVYGLNPYKSIGLGVVLLSINSILLAALHSFYFGGVPWEMAVFTMLGTLWGGRLGPYLGQFVSLKSIKIIFAIIAILDGALITWQSLKALLK